MTRPGPPIRVSPEWLALREPADAAARALDLIAEVRQPFAHTDVPAARLLWPNSGRSVCAGQFCMRKRALDLDAEVRRSPAENPLVVHDLGCGTGSMARWLAPRLPGSQHWILYDHDAELLAGASGTMPNAAADGSAISSETRVRDITGLPPGELAGAGLITASALLDMLTGPELDRLVTACVDASCPVLLTISVIGRVAIWPADPLDDVIGDAFNAHQRRVVDGRHLLGPDAVGTAAQAFRRLSRRVLTRSSPWRLGPDQGALITEWLAGWVGAAAEQRAELTGLVPGYLHRRAAELAAGRLTVTVHHDDLLALPP